MVPPGGVPQRLAVGAFESTSLTSHQMASLDRPSVRPEVAGGWAERGRCLWLRVRSGVRLSPAAPAPAPGGPRLVTDLMRASQMQSGALSQDLSCVPPTDRDTF